MSPIPVIGNILHTLVRRDEPDNPEDRPSDPNGLVLEAWGEFGLGLRLSDNINIRSDG